MGRSFTELENNKILIDIRDMLAELIAIEHRRFMLEQERQRITQAQIRTRVTLSEDRRVGP